MRRDSRPIDAASRLVGAAIAGIEEHALSNARVGELAASLGVSDRHLRRVTEAELGVSPIELAQTQRLLLAKRLLSETSLKLTDIAFASGFGSLRRFNALFKSRYGLCPRELRGRRHAAGRLALPARIPAAAGVGRACSRTCGCAPFRAWSGWTQRTIGAPSRSTSTEGWIGVSLAKSGIALDVEMSPTLAPVIGAVIVRVKHLFDLGAAPDAVSALLSQDPLLAGAVRRLPGLRVRGGVRRLRARGARRARPAGVGESGDHTGRALGAGVRRSHRDAVPAAQSIAPERAAHGRGRTRTRSVRSAWSAARARCLIALAQAVVQRRVVLAYAANVEEQIEALERLPGIGPWTAQYIAMRALHWPDAFPGGDLMLLRAAKVGRKELQARAEAWRPWRAYATHYLWQSLGGRPMNRFTYIESPIGRLLLTCDGEALTGLYMDVPGRRPPRDSDDWAAGCGRGSAAGGRAAARASISPAPGASSICRCASQGTEFQRRVWRRLTEIRYGETLSYGELAKRIGNPNASRAVGLANGRNPISIRGAVSSGDRRRRLAHRIRRRPRAQALAARARRAALALKSRATSMVKIAPPPSGRLAASALPS